MLSEPDFDKSIFLNCPFDKEFEAILQAIIFAICYMGYRPRLALETQNSAELRLNKIRSMIEDCRFSIHDLSRSQAKRKGEYYRLNMPFELGLDYGCRHYMDGRQDKVILVLEEKPYRYQAALSDLAGCDIQAHGNEPEKAVRIVRNWLAHERGLQRQGLPESGHPMEISKPTIGIVSWTPAFPKRTSGSSRRVPFLRLCRSG